MPQDGTEQDISVDAAPRSPIEYARRQVALAELVSPPREVPAVPSDTFPGYTLTELIHRGGQGVVYKAVQASTERTVAIKVLRTGRFCDAVERLRFRRELDVLGKLKHPHIVTLYDGGTVDELPYLVMDFIEGRPLDVYIRSRNLTVRDALQLFMKICAGVNAAHVRGIIHRDLKPANILVDGHGDPHILDFGLAKLISADDDAGGDRATITGQFLGSLHWASPEQARGLPDEIDIRTDVHALGLILFFLLTGRLPFDPTTPAHTALRNIIESEPPQPGAARRGLDDDLNIVTQKCLAKDRDDRYQHVTDLMADIQRFMAGEPIEARRESTWYVLAKTVRRHRKAAIALCLAVAATLVYAVTITAMYGRAVTAELEADRSATEAHNAKRDSQKTIEVLVGDVAQRLKRIDGAEEARRIILENAYENLQKLLEQRADDPALQADYACTLRDLGGIDQALGRHRQAFERFSEALEIRRALASAALEVPDRQAALSLAMVRVGDVAKELGDVDVTREYYAEALAIDEALVEEFPANPYYLDNLVWSHERMGAFVLKEGRIGPAMAHFNLQLESARALLDLEPGRSGIRKAIRRAHAHRADIAVEIEDWPMAAESIRETLAMTEQVFKENPGDVEARKSLARACLATARPLSLTGCAQEALDNCARAEALFRPLVELAPNDADSLRLLLQYHGAMTAINSDMRNADACDEHIRATQRILEQLAEFEPDRVETRERILVGLGVLARRAAQRGDETEARALSLRALTLAEELMESGPATIGLLRTCARLLNEVYPEDLRDTAEAVRLCKLAAERTNYQHPAILWQLGDLYAANGEPQLAIATYQQSLLLPGLEGLPVVDDIRSRIHALETAASEGG